jgi:hypothetical protein
MKILYLTKKEGLDYQDDCLLIGLKELYGEEVIDYNKREHLYTNFNQDVKLFYGKGMTVTKVLPDLNVDRTDLHEKIKNKYFDLIVYGSIYRYCDYFNFILEYYSKDRIVIVDGEDITNIHSVFDYGIPYFKRELIYVHERLHPISFAMPTSKGYFNKQKIKDYSYITPQDLQTYIYEDEKNYYQDYQEAKFGITTKKCGWDSLRHYEILGNGCIPYFLNIEQCPSTTLTMFPKHLCQQVNKAINNKEISLDQLYNNFINLFEDHYLNNNTTKALANNFIDKIFKNTK